MTEKLKPDPETDELKTCLGCGVVTSPWSWCEDCIQAMEELEAGDREQDEEP